jgi:hypothetical protein
MSKKKNQEATVTVAGGLPALPPRRRRRRSVRGSHSWCWRRPPSRKRVEVAHRRFLPEPVPVPAFIPVYSLDS